MYACSLPDWTMMEIPVMSSPLSLSLSNGKLSYMFANTTMENIYS